MDPGQLSQTQIMHLEMVPERPWTEVSTFFISLSINLFYKF